MTLFAVTPVLFCDDDGRSSSSLMKKTTADCHSSVHMAEDRPLTATDSTCLCHSSHFVSNSSPSSATTELFSR